MLPMGGCVGFGSAQARRDAGVASARRVLSVDETRGVRRRDVRPAVTRRRPARDETTVARKVRLVEPTTLSRRPIGRSLA